MVNLAEKIVEHFRDQGFSEEKISMDGIYKFHFIDISFDTHPYADTGRDIEIEIKPPQGTEEDFRRHLNWVQNRVFEKDYVKLGENARMYRNHLRKSMFDSKMEGGIYRFVYSANLASKNSKKTFEGILYNVIKPIMLFRRNPASSEQ